MTTRLPLLLAAYQCGPGMGSVSQIGWEWYSRLARSHDVTLVTHARNREALSAAGAPLANSEIIYIDTEWFAGPLYRLAKTLFPKSEHSVFLLSSLDYFLYDRLALAELRRRRAQGSRWALLHRVTPVTLAAPSVLHRLGLPVVVGPVNCGLENPAGFPEIMAQDAGWLVKARRLPALLDAWLGSTRTAAAILTATRAAWRAVPQKYRAKCRPMLENGVDLEEFATSRWPSVPGSESPLEILFVGRLVPFKGVGMLLEAIARLTAAGVACRLTIAGDGPMAQPWQEQAKKLGIAGRVRFLGNREHAEIPRLMAGCHVFCLPSVRESGGAVLIEAMACARPVIALNHGGPAELVDKRVGALLPASDAVAVVSGFVNALRDVVEHPTAWALRGAEGRRRAEQRYGWEAKLAMAEKLYCDVLIKGAASCT